jgi:hypothetical protein
MQGKRVEIESPGARLIAAERQRQIEGEGWTLEHDDIHDSGELVAASISYARLALGDDPDTVLEFTWPWGREWFKPSPNAIRNLVKAGALIAAEIDRLSRSNEVRADVDGRA